jgi:8-oxo-dGTP diphosphatase
VTEIRQRVVCYITRGRRELLVFEHDDPGLQVGTQVVAGGVDEGETLEAAAMREVFEEAGLELQNPILLGSKDVIWPGPKNPNQHWHFYWLEAPKEMCNAWDHTVTAGEDDMGMVYRQRFVKLEEVKLDWGLGDFLNTLETEFRASSFRKLNADTQVLGHAIFDTLREIFPLQDTQNPHFKIYFDKLDWHNVGDHSILRTSFLSFEITNSNQSEKTLQGWNHSWFTIYIGKHRHYVDDWYCISVYKEYRYTQGDDSWETQVSPPVSFQENDWKKGIAGVYKEIKKMQIGRKHFRAIVDDLYTEEYYKIFANGLHNRLEKTVFAHIVDMKEVRLLEEPVQ